MTFSSFRNWDSLPRKLRPSNENERKKEAGNVNKKMEDEK